MESPSDVLTILEGRVARTLQSRQRRLTITLSQLKRLVVRLGGLAANPGHIPDIYFTLNKRSEHAQDINARHVSITLKQANEVVVLLKTAGNVEENL